MPKHLALLPTGLRDLLPPHSTREAQLAHQLLKLVASYGYELVKPPLVEFEQTLLSGSGQALSRQIFRLMDPLSQQMMAVRADTTLQIARIAGSRLQNEPRPLRLAYCGEVLRVAGTQLFPERQFCQLGVELIGIDSAAADAEMILLAADCMQVAGISGVSIDLSLPGLLSQLLASHSFPPSESAALAEAVERRDLTAIKRIGKTLAPLLEKLISVSGRIDSALEAMRTIDLPASVQPQLKQLQETVAQIQDMAPDIILTLDPLERRGFEYHTALSFAVFLGAHGEVGRGGRYQSGEGEPATGFTFLLDNLLDALPQAADMPRVYMPKGTPAKAAQALRDQDLHTIMGLDEVSDIRGEAKRLKCTHYWSGTAAVQLEG